MVVSTQDEKVVAVTPVPPRYLLRRGVSVGLGRMGVDVAFELTWLGYRIAIGDATVDMGFGSPTLPISPLMCGEQFASAQMTKTPSKNSKKI